MLDSMWLEHAVSTPDPHILQGDGGNAFPTFDVLEQVSWLKPGSVKAALSRPAHPPLTQTVRGFVKYVIA